jgi:hypothetical protein
MKIDTDSYERGNYPHIAVGFNSWVTWADMGRKQPFCPYSDLPRKSEEKDDQFSWSNAENLTDHDTAREWARKHPKLKGLGFIIQHESDPYKEPADPLTLVDFDDCVTPDGEVHPYVVEILEQAGTYADLSDSFFNPDKDFAGIHLLGVGELPEGIRTIQDDLPEHDKWPDAEIEVYDRKRFCAMSGVWLTSSNREVSDIGDTIDRLTDEFETTDRTQDTEPSHAVDVDNDAFQDVDYTDDFDRVKDAIDSVGRRDIKLTSRKTGERSEGVIDYDPSYRNSHSGMGLAWFNQKGVWCDRDGQHYMDALALVALEEGIITRPTDYPSGEDFWKAVERLRERGANIPRYTENDADHFKLHSRTEDSTKQDVKKLKSL